MSNKSIGARIRRLREAAGLRQQDLADAIGLTRTSITNIEKGIQPVSVENLRIIAEKFGVSLDFLAGHEVPTLDNQDSTSTRANVEINAGGPEHCDPAHRQPLRSSRRRT